MNPSPESPLSGHVGEHYIIERELGAGGMAVVYLARDTRYDRPVALKVLRPELARTVGPARFLAEIRLTANLQHPHILPLYDSGEAQGRLYYVMPYVEGHTLRSRLGSGSPLPLAEAVQVLSDVAQALQYAHARGVVHRDIKPDNVLLAGGAAVVGDFGIAKAVQAARADGGRALTEAGSSIGTPAYMAPEQAAGAPDIDHRADLYAFGCLAYEVLGGRVPFEGSPQRVMTGHLAEAPTPLGTLRPDVPATLDALVMQCLQKEPSARPQSATELLTVLGTLSGGTGSIMVPRILQGDPRSFGRVLALYLAAVALVVGAAWLAQRQIGLPSWVVPGAAAVMAGGIPVLLFIGYVQYSARRVVARTPTFTPGGSPVRWTLGATLALKAARHVSWRRAARAGVIAVGAFALLTAGYMGLRAAGIGPAGTLIASGRLGARPQLLITDFAVTGADSSIGWAASLAVRSALSQSTALTLVGDDLVRVTLQRMQRSGNSPVDFATGREIATREGIPALVAGQVIRTGTSYDVGLRLVSADSGSDLAGPYRATAASLDDVIPTIDRLTRKLRGKIGESLRSVNASPALPRATTHSMEALRLYAANIRTNDWLTAVKMMEEAVQLDSQFAEGWRRLAVVYGNAGIGGARRDSAVVKAYRYSGRLPDRERLLIVAQYNFWRGDRGGAIEALQRAMELGDSSASPINLAGGLHSRREYARAESLDTRYLSRHPHTALIYGNLAQRQMELGKLDEAEATIDLGLSRFPDFVGLPVAKARVLYLRGRLDQFERALDSLRASPNLNTRRNALGLRREYALLRGRLAEWRRLRAEAATLDSVAGTGPGPAIHALHSAEVELWLRGDTAGAVARLLEALQGTTPAPPALLFVGEFLATAGRPDLTRDYVARFEAAADTAAKRRFQLLLYRLQAAVALEGRRFGEALEAVRQGDRLPDGPVDACMICPSLALGRVFDRAGEADSAIAMLEHFVNTPYSNRLNHVIDPLHLPRTYRRLGELHEAKGNRERARHYYTRFVELWDRADPELQPQVKAVRARLAELVREPVGQALRGPPSRP